MQLDKPINLTQEKFEKNQWVLNEILQLMGQSFTGTITLNFKEGGISNIRQEQILYKQEK